MTADDDAEAAIKRVILRYCRAVDRIDLPLLRSCYHPDAIEEHGSFSGSVDEYVAWVASLLEKFDMTMHLVGNVLVECDGPDSARAETYGLAFHRGDPDTPSRNLTTGFRYVDRFERRDGEWRIARRVAITEWSRLDDPRAWWEVPPTHRTGRRDREDPVYWV
jgi:ketosteroid isomerase-like protein